MKKSVKILALLMVVCFVLVFSLAGCGSSSSKTIDPQEIKVAYWGTAAEQTHAEFKAKGVETVYPGMKIKLQQYPSSDEFWAAIPAAIAAKSGPDVIAFSSEGNSEYMANGALEPLEDLIKTTKFDKTKIIASLWNGWTYNDKIYGIPMDVSTSMFSINTDMMAKAGITAPPTTMDEVLADAKAMTTGGVKGIGVWLQEFHLTQYIHAFGGDWGNGKTINSAENATGLQYVVDLFKVSKVAITPKEVGAAWDGEAFGKGKVAMTTGGPWYVGYLKDSFPDIKYTAVIIPKGTVNKQSAYSHGYSITAQSKYKEAAMECISYMVRDEAQDDGIKTVGWAPAVASKLPTYVDTLPQLKPIFDSLDANGMNFNYPEQTTAFNAALAKGMEEIVFKADTKMTVKSLLDDLQKTYGSK
jgi:multiple sugar transport system substrate-binding protein